MPEKLSREDLKKKIRELERRLSKKNSTNTQAGNADKSYESIFNAANDAIVIHDLIDGSVLDVNRKMLEMYGYSYREAIHLDLHAVSEGVPPYSEAEAFELVKKAASGQPQIFQDFPQKPSLNSCGSFTNNEFDQKRSENCVFG